MNKRVLITGGAGFIGSNLARYLLDEMGYNVTVLDDMSSGRLDNIMEMKRENPGFTLRVGSITNKEQVLNAAAGCTDIYHLAAVVGIKRVMKNPFNCVRAAIRGTLNVLETALAFGVRRVFIASSSQVYGTTPEICREHQRIKLSLSPVWIYAAAKALEEYMGLAAYRDSGLEVVIGRLFNVVGPGQSGSGGHVFPRFVEAALKDETIKVYGTGTQERGFAHVDDVVKQIVELMETEGTAGEIFNIASLMKPITINQLAHAIRRELKSRSLIVLVPYAEAYSDDQYDDVKSRTPDLSKIRKVVKHVPEKFLSDMIQDVAADLKKRGIVKG